MMESNQAKKALILCGDTLHKVYCKKNDRTNRPFFSDAGSATTISISNDNNSIGTFHMVRMALQKNHC